MYTTSKKFDLYQDRIESIKRSFSSPLAGIFKYTLSDADKYINISLFRESISCVSQQDVDNVLTFLSLWSERNKELLADVAVDSLLNDAQKNFIRNAALHIQKWFDMLSCAVYIEAEKGWFTLDESKRKELLESIESYETLLYGPRISDVLDEKNAVLDYLSHLDIINKGVLTIDEQFTFMEFLERFWRESVWVDIGKNKNIVTSDHKKYGAGVVASVLDKVYRIYGESPVLIKEKKDITEPSFIDGVYIIPVWFHKKDKEAFYRKHNVLSNTKIVVSDVATNFFVWVNQEFDYHSITFPSNEQYTLDRLCQLIDHEIGTHFVRNKNASVGVDVRSAWYLETEEGIATSNEQLATRNWSDLSAWDPTIHHISTFIAENYDAEETKKLLTIYYKLMGKLEAQAIKEAIARTERVKRYHANDLPGANRKDTVYWRGMKTVVDYLKNVDIETLQHDADLIYRGKFADTDLVDIDGLFDGLRVDPSKRISPLALGKILYERYQGNVITKQTLQEKDKRFHLTVQDLTFSQKRELLDILKLLN
jgi:hypothetical protein